MTTKISPEIDRLPIGDTIDESAWIQTRLPEIDRLPIAALQMEHVRSLGKYGNWDDLTFEQMKMVLLAELVELNTAIVKEDFQTVHGVFDEAIQVANCALKLAIQARKRGKK